MRLERHHRTAAAVLAAGLALAAVAGFRFRRQFVAEPLFPSPALTRTARLSEWHGPLAGTPFDTDVFVFDGATTGGTLLLCGGTHPNEPAAYLAAVTLLENLSVKAGRVLVIARANAAGFTHNDSQDAGLSHYDIPTTHGARRFRNGSRFTNPVLQWPDPGVYVNPRPAGWKAKLTEADAGNPGPGGQTLGGVDSRNLNRVYPGLADGTPTEQTAWAVMELIRREKVDLAIDLHEASPEYPTINVIVAHQRALGLATAAELLLGEDGMSIATDQSAMNLRGLSHREWGDATPALALLMESANPAQGRLKGRTSPDQITAGRDGAYWRVQIIQRRLNERLAAMAKAAVARGGKAGETGRRILNTEIPAAGVPVAERVARHITATRRLVEAYNEEHADRPIAVGGIPPYRDLVKQGVGRYLHGPVGQAPSAP